MKPEVIIYANGPGEVMGWLEPTLKELRYRLNDNIRVTVMIPPCDFASGNEYDMVSSMNMADQIVPPGDYLKFFVLGSLFRKAKFYGKKGIVLHLGGDHFQSGTVAKRLGYKALVYSEGRLHHKELFDTVITNYAESKERLVKSGVPAERIVTAGNLMIDAVNVKTDKENFLSNLCLDPDKPVVGLLPGSRPKLFPFMMTMLAGVAEQVNTVAPETQFVMVVSPGISEEMFMRSVAEAGLHEEDPADDLKYANDGITDQRGYILTRNGTKIVIIASNRYDTMNCMTLAVALPGTNNIELAYLGVPMVITIPLNIPDAIPLEGIAGLIGSIPIIGRMIKAAAIKRYSSRLKYASLPNIRAGKMITPEVRGVLEPSDITEEIVRLLGSVEERKKISEDLRRTAGGSGAASRIVDIIMDKLEYDGTERNDL